jgi:hypothetical protein
MGTDAHIRLHAAMQETLSQTLHRSASGVNINGRFVTKTEQDNREIMIDSLITDRKGPRRGTRQESTENHDGVDDSIGVKNLAGIECE